MDAKQAEALRKPFDKKAIGILPKPYKKDSPKAKCGECGGFHGMPAVHLDYVGHAATTDRLLQVDPEWTWRPMATDPETGLPLPDASGNLWIWLTVCGVTRPGCGDGASMKERIGDAIRNAAMRFGVALDLWSKEELEGAHGEAEKPERKAERVREPQEDKWTDQPATPLPMADRTRARMFALFGEQGINDADAQRDGIGRIIGHPIASRSELTEGEAQEVIKVLASRPKPDESTARNY